MEENNASASQPRIPIVRLVYRTMTSPIQRLYVWMMRWGGTPQAEKALFCFSFCESSFFPIPPDPLLIAMVIANAKKWARIAAIATVASVLGALGGYVIGMLFFESIGRTILDAYDFHDEFAAVGTAYAANAFLAVITAAVTPIPFKVFTLAAGFFAINPLVLFVASVIGRGGRFFLVAFAARHFGARYKETIEKYIDLLGIAFLALIILGYLAINFAL